MKFKSILEMNEFGDVLMDINSAISCLLDQDECE